MRTKKSAPIPRVAIGAKWPPRVDADLFVLRFMARNCQDQVSYIVHPTSSGIPQPPRDNRRIALVFVVAPVPARHRLELLGVQLRALVLRADADALAPDGARPPWRP